MASKQGRSERELLNEAVMSYLERSDPRHFEELLARMPSRFELGEEALRLANEELHAMRRERRAAQYGEANPQLLQISLEGHGKSGC